MITRLRIRQLRVRAYDYKIKVRGRYKTIHVKAHYQRYKVGERYNRRTAGSLRAVYFYALTAQSDVHYLREKYIVTNKKDYKNSIAKLIRTAKYTETFIMVDEAIKVRVLYSARYRLLQRYVEIHNRLHFNLYENGREDAIKRFDKDVNKIKRKYKMTEIPLKGLGFPDTKKLERLARIKMGLEI